MAVYRWRPQVPDGWIRFGDHAVVGYGPPTEKVVIARDHPTAFRKPDAFNLLWQKINRGNLPHHHSYCQNSYALSPIT
jgi:hypothetical protein